MKDDLKDKIMQEIAVVEIQQVRRTGGVDIHLKRKRDREEGIFLKTWLCSQKTQACKNFYRRSEVCDNSATFWFYNIHKTL